MTEHGCKVCRVLAERGLEHLNDEFVARWKGDEGERLGYRRLADWLNVTMLRAEMEIVGMPTEAGEAHSRYDRLVGDDERAAEMRGLLKRGGVAVDDLLGDFVSYSVVRTHLGECLGAERDPAPPTDWEADRIAQLARYATEEAEAAVCSLANKGELHAGGEIETTVSVEISCANCGVAVPFAEAIERTQFCGCV